MAWYCGPLMLLSVLNALFYDGNPLCWSKTMQPKKEILREFGTEQCDIYKSVLR